VFLPIFQWKLGNPRRQPIFLNIMDIDDADATSIRTVRLPLQFVLPPQRIRPNVEPGVRLMEKRKKHRDIPEEEDDPSYDDRSAKRLASNFSRFHLFGEAQTVNFPEISRSHEESNDESDEEIYFQPRRLPSPPQSGPCDGQRYTHKMIPLVHEPEDSSSSSDDDDSSYEEYVVAPNIQVVNELLPKKILKEICRQAASQGNEQAIVPYGHWYSPNIRVLDDDEICGDEIYPSSISVEEIDEDDQPTYSMPEMLD